ncbi:Alpha/Beta hydrolase protein [Xylaria nigripes]|nr:Alpha/Beta hydrolase protein [Xylaria nigripes]
MIGTSVPEYVFIRLGILSLQYTTPICLGYLLVLTAIEGTTNALSRTSSWVLVGYSILDALYALFIYYPYNRRLKRKAEHPPLLPRAERRALFAQCLDNVPNISIYLRKWFLGADESDIRRENVSEFLSWAFFDRHPGNETAEELEELDEYVVEVERRLGHHLQPGWGKAKSLRLTLDKIEVRYRSVGWYFIIGLVDLVTHLQLAYHGFHYYALPMSHSSVIPLRPQSFLAQNRSVSELSYWYRPHRSKNKIPLVFLHGIGVGLWTYVSYLSEINSNCSEDDQVGIIALEYLPVSARLTDPPLSQSEFLSQLTAILDAHGWSRFAVVGHSYGTVLATHMLKSPGLNARIESIVLVDPVCILLHLPDVAYNFTRRKPRRANEYLLWYFASMEPGVAHCMGRHFFWKDSIAWKEDLVRISEKPFDGTGMNGSTQPKKPRSRRVTVCLAEQDLIVNTPAVLQYLINDKDWVIASHQLEKNSSIRIQHPTRFFERNGIEVVWFDGLDHAQAFDGKECSASLAAVTRRSCKWQFNTAVCTMKAS